MEDVHQQMRATDYQGLLLEFEQALQQHPIAGQAPWRKVLKDKAWDVIRQSMVEGGEDALQQMKLARRALRKLGQQRISHELLH
eukprot:11466335-Prorocentrum_lima.AAC.1